MLRVRYSMAADDILYQFFLIKLLHDYRQLLGKLIQPPIDNLRRSEKRLLSSALSSFHHEILGELISKLFTADGSELLGAMSVSTSAGANILIYRTSSPFPSSHADCNSVGTRNVQKILARDNVDAITESVREPEEPSYTRSLQPSPVSEPLSLPLHRPLRTHAKTRRKVPLWRRIFRNLCCTATAAIRSDTRERSERAWTPPTAALLPTISNDMHDPEPPNSYSRKYLLMCPSEGIGIVTREDSSSEVSRDGAVHRELIFSSEMRIGNILEGYSISNGRRICWLAPELVKLRLAKCSIRSNCHSIDEHELVKCDNTSFLNGSYGAEGCEATRFFEIQVAAYQDLHVLVCTPRPKDIDAIHSLNSDISSETARVEAKAGTDTGAGAGRALCPPVFRVLSPLSQSGWKQFHILCSMCLADTVEDINSPRLVKAI